VSISGKKVAWGTWSGPRFSISFLLEPLFSDKFKKSALSGAEQQGVYQYKLLNKEWIELQTPKSEL